jgi:hypothetical protein
MNSTALFVVGLCLAQAEMPVGTPVAPQAMPVACATGGNVGYSYEMQGNFSGVDPWSCPNGQGDCYMTGGCPTPFVRQRMCCWRTTGDFYPHYPYPAPYFGYYYLKPYNWVHVADHQAFAAKWGGDPRVPYGHEYFNRLYESSAVAPQTKYDPNSRGSLTKARKLPNIQALLDVKYDESPATPAPPAPVDMPAVPAEAPATN